MSQEVDKYFTIQGTGEARYTEKMSRFLSFAIPVSNVDEAKAEVKRLQNEYHDARHVCWAYMIGSDRNEWQLNDNGEPSGTAGKPILGQINSFNVTNLVVIVVRYFGGIKLGTPGLIAAYREAAKLAIEEAGIKEMCRMGEISFHFPYVSAEGVMKIVKKEEVNVLDRTFDNTCGMRLETPQSNLDHIRTLLSKVDGLSFTTE